MKIISLSNGLEAIVDDEDYEEMSKFKWHASTFGYAIRNYKTESGKWSMMPMHRQILRVTGRTLVDHIDGNRLNCVRSNMRLTDKSGNGCNRGKPSNNKSGFKGVCWHKANKAWAAQIGINGEHKYLGCFPSPEEAHEAYKAAANTLHGEFACADRDAIRPVPPIKRARPDASKVTGVTLRKSGMWVARLPRRIGGENKRYIGQFPSRDEAMKAVEAALT